MRNKLMQGHTHGQHVADLLQLLSMSEMGDTWANELAREMEETAAIMLDGKPTSSCV
jgi:hypothetical protein